MTIQPTRNRNIEAVDESKRLLEEWFEGYNEVDVGYLRSRCHYPLVSFGGGRLRWNNLDFTVREDPQEFVPNNRDHGWGFSLVDRWAVHQHTPQKAHLITDFRRLRDDGSAYYVGQSRLAIITKRSGEWGVNVLSSCGTRNPANIEHDSDQNITSTVTEVIQRYFEASNRDDELESFYHYPFVNVDGNEVRVIEDQASSNIHRPETDLENGKLFSIEVLPPQAGDKVVVDVNVETRGEDGERNIIGGIFLVTKQGDSWGVQLRSVGPNEPAIL